MDYQFCNMLGFLVGCHMKQNECVCVGFFFLGFESASKASISLSELGGFSRVTQQICFILQHVNLITSLQIKVVTIQR